MALENDLRLNKPIMMPAHRALLNIYYTASCLKKFADVFFKPFGLTDVQFNVLMLLGYQSGPEGGLSQAQLSDMMLVNRANITTLIDRMEKADLVVRTAAAKDRRYNIVKMTAKGKKLFAKVEPLYSRQVQKLMNVLKESDQKALIKTLGKLRNRLSR
ncbi:MAG: MarR family winged helix-turn-helix transcriptional regulator [Planctomycetota bacterium]|jgi:DNA-binding MarR family transcriptional regulator